jgi:hypothetical protein
MSRRLRRWLIVLGVLLVLGVAFVWSLPEIVKWQALKQIPAITGRAASIEDIDINLFTGRVAIKKFRLAEPDPAQTFVEFERFDVRVVPWSIVFGNVRVAELRLTAPTVNLVRVSPTEFNFSDILKRIATPKEGALPPKPVDPKAKSRWTIAVNHFALIRANITAIDRAVTPTSEWKVRDLSIEAGNLTTRPSGPVGTLAVRAALNDSPVEFSAQDIDLTPTSFAGKFSIQNFSLLQVRPYLPPLPATLDSGIAGVNMAVKLELGPGPGGLAIGLVTGDVGIASLALSQPGKTTPFLAVPRIAIGLKEVNLVSRVVTLSSVDIEGLDLRAVRDKREQIDLLDLTKKPAAASAPASSEPAAAHKPAPAAKVPAAGAAGTPAAPAPAPPVDAGYKITVEKVALKGSATFTDEAISSPPTVLKIGGLNLQLGDVTWPAARPMQLDLAMVLPGGGKFGAKGPVGIDPVDVSLALTTHDAPIEPYHAYFPFPASFSGRFSAETQNRVRIVHGKLTALSRGNAWATDLAVKEPDGKDAPLRLQRLDISGIDFAWPTRARVARIRLKQPVGEVDRAADGTINVQKLFTPAPKPGAPASATPPPKASEKPAPAGPTAKPQGPLETMELYFKEIVIEDGYTRFLDHTTQPPFSEDISKISLVVKDLSNKASQRASLAMQAAVGGDSAMDIRGEMAAIGAPTYVDMVGELRKFALPAANPYMDSVLAWIIRRGELTAKLEYKIEQDKLDAKNDILVGNLRVAPSRASDEVKKRIGLPLGLIVALIKDGDGNIHVNVPITGSLSDRQFNFSDAIWTAVRNVIVNVLKAPFRAIGGLFTSGDKIDELKVDPVTFAAGSVVLSPEMERQTVRVGDFLRRAPYVGLTLTSVTSPEDEETLKERAVAARLEKFQKDQGIGDPATALRRYYQVAVKDAQLPKTVDDQLLLLRKREPVPTAALAELKRRRLEVTRERLAKVEGIPEARLVSAPEGAAPATPGPPAGATTPVPAPPPAATAPAPAPPPPAAAPTPATPSASAPAAPSSGAPSAGGRVEFGITGEGD